MSKLNLGKKNTSNAIETTQITTSKNNKLSEEEKYYESEKKYVTTLFGKEFQEYATLIRELEVNLQTKPDNKDVIDDLKNKIKELEQETAYKVLQELIDSKREWKPGVLSWKWWVDKVVSKSFLDIYNETISEVREELNIPNKTRYSEPWTDDCSYQVAEEITNPVYRRYLGEYSETKTGMKEKHFVNAKYYKDFREYALSIDGRMMIDAYYSQNFLEDYARLSYWMAKYAMQTPVMLVDRIESYKDRIKQIETEKAEEMVYVNGLRCKASEIFEEIRKNSYVDALKDAREDGTFVHGIEEKFPKTKREVSDEVKENMNTLCQDEIAEYKLFLTKSNWNSKWCSVRINVIEEEILKKVAETSDNKEEALDDAITVLKEIYDNVKNKTQAEKNILGSFDSIYYDPEKKWDRSIMNPVYDYYVKNRALYRDNPEYKLEDFDEFASVNGDKILKSYYQENILEEYERLCYLHSKLDILKSDNTELMQKYEKRIKEIETLASEGKIEEGTLTKEDVIDSLIGSKKLAHLRSETQLKKDDAFSFEAELHKDIKELLKDEYKEYKDLTYKVAYAEYYGSISSEKLQQSRDRINELEEDILGKTYNTISGYHMINYTIDRLIEISDASRKRARDELKVPNSFDDIYYDGYNNSTKKDINNKYYCWYLKDVTKAEGKKFNEYLKDFEKYASQRGIGCNGLSGYEATAYWLHKTSLVDANNKEKIDKLASQVNSFEKSKKSLLDYLKLEDDEVEKVIKYSKNVAFMLAEEQVKKDEKLKDNVKDDEVLERVSAMIDEEMPEEKSIPTENVKEMLAEEKQTTRLDETKNETQAKDVNISEEEAAKLKELRDTIKEVQDNAYIDKGFGR